MSSLSLSFLRTQNAFSINYPSLDDPPPYEKEDTTQQGGDEAIGQLIDLGIDLNTPQPPPTSKDDIVNQLAQIGEPQLQYDMKYYWLGINLH